jgi:actin-related protein 2
MVGEEAARLRAVLELNHPIDNGIIKDWDMMEKLWEHGIYDKLGVVKENVPNMQILLSEAPKNPKLNREKMAEIMFEKFGFGSLRIIAQALLSMYSEVI